GLMTARFLLELRKWHHQQTSSSSLSRFAIDLGTIPTTGVQASAQLEGGTSLGTFAVMEPEQESEERDPDADWEGVDERGSGKATEMTFNESTVGTEWDPEEGSSRC